MITLLRRSIWLLMAIGFALPATASECVILLHGLAKSDASMKKLESSIADAGFSTVNVNYPSTAFSIEQLAGPAIAPALDTCQAQAKARSEDLSRVHFVTHSMGGILVRQYLSRVAIENLGHVVMLGPPNHGSEVVDKLGSFPGFQFMFGDAGLQLGTGNLSVPNQLGPANFDLGIIAGTRSINLFLSQMLPHSDDGKVTVDSTRLEGMNDHIEMPVTHVFMMKNRKVIRQVIHYLKHGRFLREDATPAESAAAATFINTPTTAPSTTTSQMSLPPLAWKTSTLKSEYFLVLV
ncbi:esterase/lipase family protein [Microbulbifer aggregans]|uniref:esterase/lipase family protein n=1 Tax=Microbulbifer aggregans TaxID=1769779 RepID=UPI001CFE847A|nr:alpha/beta hydrolase [Microbulbifer aggregans]